MAAHADILLRADKNIPAPAVRRLDRYRAIIVNCPRVANEDYAAL
ncbi:hypothetical protein [Azospirillum endophyticum]